MIMKIAICSIHHRSNYSGGNEMYSDTLADELQKKGHVIHYLCSHGASKHYLVHECNSWWNWFSTLLRLKPEIVHTTGTGFMLTMVGIWCWLWGIPRVATFQAPLNTSTWWRKIICLDEWLTVVLSRYVIVTSPANARYLSRYGSLRKIKTVLLCRKHGFVPETCERSVALQKIKLTPLFKYVFMLARLDQHHYYKGVEIAIRAVRLLPVRYKLIIGGDGPLIDMYKALTRKNRVQERVLFVGSIPESQLPFFYAASIVHIMPSTSQSEGFGLVLLEAMLSRIPTITTDVVGISPVLRDKGLATIIPANNPHALASAIQQAKRNKRVIEAAYQFANGRTAQRMTQETEQVYEYALS